MKRIIGFISFVVLVLLVAFFCECCSGRESKYIISDKSNVFDFGSGVYKEPFVGILESRPQILVESLEYPPYKWCIDDTLRLYRDFNVKFNEECLRSSSVIHLRFNSRKNITFFYEGKRIKDNGLKIVADSPSKKINIECRVSPSVGENSISDRLDVSSSDVDVVNDSQTEGYYSIGKWKIKQEFGCPFLLWTLWGLSFLLLLGLLILLIWFVCKRISFSRRNSSRKNVIPLQTSRAENIDSKDCVSNVVMTQNKEDEKQSLVKYRLLPRVGEKYADGLGGYRTLVIGASSYCTKNNCKNHENCINGLCPQNYVCPENGERIENSVITELNIFLTGASGYTTYKKFSDFIRERFAESDTISDVEIWERVSFYEYVQKILSSYQTPQYHGAYIEQYDEYYEQMQDVIKSLSPQLLVVWGKPVSEAIIANCQKRGFKFDVYDNGVAVWDGIVMCFITHPSSPQWNSDEVYSILSKAFDVLATLGKN